VVWQCCAGAGAAGAENASESPNALCRARVRRVLALLKEKNMKKPVLALGMLGSLPFASEPVIAQSSQNGPYYANPSWD
jgi:hypothetical protein